MKTQRESQPASTLAALAPGGEAEVLSVDASDPVGRRLVALGLAAGTRVRVLRRAPLGDPTLYELRGFQLSLRQSEALRVRIKGNP